MSKDADIKFPRGSEWRKWDLHIHTPISFENSFKEQDENWSQYKRDLKNKAIKHDIEVAHK